MNFVMGTIYLSALSVLSHTKLTLNNNQIFANEMVGLVNDAKVPS